MTRIVCRPGSTISARGRSLVAGLRRAIAWLGVGLGLATAVLAGPAPCAAEGRGEGRLIELLSGRKVGGIRVAVGKSETLRTDASFIDIVVGDPEIADVMPLTDRSLYVLGRKIGTTSVSIYDAGKKLVGVIDVEVSYNTSRLAAEIARRLPTAAISVSSVNGRIILSGSVPDGVTLDKALTLAKQFGSEVINSLSVTQPQQVMLEVRFIEAARSAGRELGISFDVLAKNFTLLSGTAGLVSAPGAATTGLISGSTPFGSMLGTILTNGVQADVLIRALEEKGLVRRLAEPNLVAQSGERASFLAGGEFPIPVQADLGRITVEFKKFGVGLSFTPTVLAHGLINLKIEPEVSQPDTTNKLRISGIEVPSLTVRRAATTIDLRDGQSFAIAGLLQDQVTTSDQQLPWIGDIPVLGALFRSASYQKRETDLAIIVTPRIVRPARPGDSLKTPLDATKPGNDVDYFLLGKSEVWAKSNGGSQREMTAANPGGHIIDIPRGATYVEHR
jgi:pilus assembly protein CpaC